MNKKWLKLGAVFGIGASLLVASGLSAMAGTSGYDTYADALKKTSTVSSLSDTGQLTVTDNGNKIFSADIQSKLNRGKDALSAQITLGSGTEQHAVKVFKQNGKLIFTQDASDVYKVMETGEQGWHQGGQDPKAAQQVKQVIEALMGNLKELATVEDLPSGGERASLHLSGSQIPAIVQAGGSILASHLADEGNWSRHGELGTNPHELDIPLTFPKLTDNVTITAISLDADINADRYLERQTGTITITGTDESGKRHEVVITGDLHLSDYNQTAADTVDLSGKKVETIEQKDHSPQWHH